MRKHIDKYGNIWINDKIVPKNRFIGKTWNCDNKKHYRSSKKKSSLSPFIGDCSSQVSFVKISP